MGRYIGGRVVSMLVTFLIIASLTFFLMKLLPGTPFNNQEKMSESQIQQMNEKYGLNDPVPVQYVTYMTNLFKGDLGVSFQQDGRSVTTIIGERIGPSAYLGFQSLLIGTIFGLLLGIIAALKHNTFLDYGSMIIAVLGISIPSFVIAGMMQYWVGVKWGMLPVAYWEGFEYTIMPTIAIAAAVTATIARFMRTEMLEVLGQDYITTAKAKGLTSTAVVIKHTIRNASIPIITIMGPMVVALMTGTLVIEQIFVIPGLGEKFVSSIMTNDFPIIMGTTLFFSILFIVVILVVDVLYGIVDPRIRLAGGK
ncbi:oligopeptide ABC transporter permease [Pseudalkalibacillus caeni]|uniref:ABC transporter permease n=1 Tax=Exobacillus caeni TaxID=2574798 RepID=A0A5R9F477_9BACL|nr:oligopeptide ABC transporter permease [Pseudalkalibacillus caeni]TLS37811.1 ABC transporter permease [Pseudalkalibacillus caeni]